MNYKIQEKLISLAKQEAQIAASEGYYPFGAIMSDSEGNIIASVHKTQETDYDPTAHA